MCVCVSSVTELFTFFTFLWEMYPLLSFWLCNFSDHFHKYHNTPLSVTYKCCFYECKFPSYWNFKNTKKVTLTNFFYFLIKMGIIMKNGKCSFFWFYMSTNHV